jgi:hypothetical protein
VTAKAWKGRSREAWAAAGYRLATELRQEAWAAAGYRLATELRQEEPMGRS